MQRFPRTDFIKQLVTETSNTDRLLIGGTAIAAIVVAALIISGTLPVWYIIVFSVLAWMTGWFMSSVQDGHPYRRLRWYNMADHKRHDQILKEMDRTLRDGEMILARYNIKWNVDRDR